MNLQSIHVWVDSIGPIDRIFETTRARATRRHRATRVDRGRSSRSSEGASEGARARSCRRSTSRARASEEEEDEAWTARRMSSAVSRGASAQTRANANAKARVVGDECACFARVASGAEVEDARRPWTRGRMRDGFDDGRPPMRRGRRRPERARDASSASTSAPWARVLPGASTPKLVVFSGGTAMNMIAALSCSGRDPAGQTHVIPVAITADPRVKSCASWVVPRSGIFVRDVCV